jgi:hypothetical protein
MEKSGVYLKVPFVKSVLENMCSENTASMYITYKSKGKIRIPPEVLNKRHCYHIFSIHKCLTEEIGKILTKKYITIISATTFTIQYLDINKLSQIIRYFIDYKEPLIASVIPDLKWNKYLKEKKDIGQYLHTILIVGYIPDTNYMLIHDQAPYETIDFNDFIRISARTNHVFVIREDFFIIFSDQFKIINDKK